MSFACTPKELVSHILEVSSFSGKGGLGLSSMWTVAAEKLKSEKLDNFQKQVVWQWLFFYKGKDDPLDAVIFKGEEAVVILPSYIEFISALGSEDELRLVPTPDMQWKFLTGLGSSKKLKQQLGEFPFQLLCEISKHGPKGVYSPDLCRATGQDPRSLPLRLKKLEELRLIKRMNVYNEKASQHTSLCIHFKFANEELSSVESNSYSDFDASRNVYQLKHYVVNAVKSAPGNLRGFKDLKCELKLDRSSSSSKFFRGIVEFLHTHGYVERLMVKDSSENTVYCIKYIKDIPKDSEEISDYVDFCDAPLDDQAQEEVDALETPLINKFFPLTNQIYRRIRSGESSGITSMELTRDLTGLSDYRPFVKLFDLLTAYNIDGNGLVPLKKDTDLKNTLAMGRTYDFEGKFKFYRYFEIDNSRRISSEPENKLSKDLGKDLQSVNKALFVPLAKTPKGPLVNYRKRKATDSDGGKKQKKIKNDDEREQRSQENDLIPDSSQSELVSRGISTNESSRTPSMVKEIQPIIPKTEQSSQGRKRASAIQKTNSSLSLKATKRRVALVNIIKELGGVTYTTTKLCRLIDERLGNSTITDKKTLARDVSVLIATGELEAQNISFVRSGQDVSRKLLILTDPRWSPTADKIEKMRAQCLEDNGTRLTFSIKRRVIEGEVTLYRQPPEIKERVESRLARAEKKTASQRRVERAESNVVKQENMQPDDQKNGLSSLVSKKQRKRKKASRKHSLKENDFMTSRYRTALRIDNIDVTTLFRAVVISKTFKKSYIDFEQIANLFGNVTSREIRQKWTSIRKQVGGLSAVNKGVEAFEYIVMKGIEDGMVSSADLESLNFNFFLDLWKDSDSSILDVIDKQPLFTSVENNLSEYYRSENTHSQVDLYEQLEDHSMRQKEAILSGVTFYEEAHDFPPAKKYHQLRTILKSIFRTPEDQFSSDVVSRLLAAYDEQDIQEATSTLIKDKEISYYSLEDSSKRFVVTDKFYNVLAPKVVSPSFFHEAYSMKEDAINLSEASKGLIVSHGVTSGQMACLLQLVSSGSIDLARVERSYTFKGYESRLIDKEKLSCDIVLIGKDIKSDDEFRVPVPTGKACSHIWLGINGEIDSQLWIKIILTVLYYVSFRPGISDGILIEKVSPVLEHDDFILVIDWLLNSRCIVKGSHGGYWVTSMWYSVLGRN